MSEKNGTKRFLDVFYRSDLLLEEQSASPKDTSKEHLHRSRQYLAIMHYMNSTAEGLNINSALPQSEMNTLLAIGNVSLRKNGIQASELSAKMRVSTAATSKMLKILEKKNLIFRTVDKKDRRRVFINLTDTGKIIYEETAKAQADFMNRVFQRMGEKDLNAYLTLWEKFNCIIEEEREISTDIVTIRRENMKTVFIEDCDFSFTEKDILARLGMPRDHVYGEKIKELLDIARPIAKPKAFFMEVPIEKRTPSTVTIGGETFVSVALAKNLSRVDTVYPILCTCGNELATYAKTLDGMMEQYAFDAIMEFYRKRITLALTEALANYLREGGLTSEVNPGSLVDWPIMEQQKLFRVFGENAEKAGVELNPNSLMFPIKTTSGIRYATDTDFHNCELCQRKNCPNREAPFDQDLYLSTIHD